MAIISIHALREESDINTVCIRTDTNDISIHALREESDVLLVKSAVDFIQISIHALREESDVNFSVTLRAFAGFLSTLSVRRATIFRSFLMRLLLNFYPRSP